MVKSNHSFEIFLKCLSGKTLTLTVTANDTVDQLKLKIQDKIGVPEYQQKLVCYGKILDKGETTLLEYDIGKETTLHLLFDKRISKVEKEIFVFIKTLTGRTVTFQVFPSNTIAELKQRVHDKLECNPRQQKLVFKGRLLKDSETLESCSIENEAILHLLVSPMEPDIPPPPQKVFLPKGESFSERLAFLGSLLIEHVKYNILRPILRSLFQVQYYIQLIRLLAFGWIWEPLSRILSRITTELNRFIGWVWSAVLNPIYRLVFISLWNRLTTSVSQVWNGISTSISWIYRQASELLSLLRPIYTPIWNGFTRSIQWTWNGITHSTSWVYHQISDGIIRMFSLIKRATISLWNGISWIYRQISQISSELLSLLQRICSPIWSGFTQSISWIWNLMKRISISLWNGMTQSISWVYHRISDGISLFVTLLKRISSFLWKQICVPIWNGFSSSISWIYRHVIVDGVSLMKRISTSVWNRFVQIISWIWNGIVKSTSWTYDQISKIASFIKRISTHLWNGLSTSVSWVWNKTTNLISWSWIRFSSSISWVYSLLKRICSPIWTGFTQSINWIWNLMKRISISLWNGFSSSISWTWNLTSRTISWIFDSLSKSISWCWNVLKDGVSAIYSRVSPVVSWFYHRIIDGLKMIFNGTKFTLTFFWNKFSSSVSWIYRKSSNGISQLLSFLKRISSSLWNGFSKSVSWIWNRILKAGASWIFSRIQEGLKWSWKQTKNISQSLKTLSVWLFDQMNESISKLYDFLSYSYSVYSSIINPVERVLLSWISSVENLICNVSHAIFLHFKSSLLWSQNMLNQYLVIPVNHCARFVGRIVKTSCSTVLNQTKSILGYGYRNGLQPAWLFSIRMANRIGNQISRAFDTLVVSPTRWMVRIVNQSVLQMLEKLRLVGNRAMSGIHWGISSTANCMDRMIVQPILRTALVQGVFRGVRWGIWLMNWLRYGDLRGVHVDGFSLDVRPSVLVSQKPQSGQPARHSWKLSDGQEYGIWLRNGTLLDCDCVLSVDGNMVGEFRLLPSQSYLIDRSLISQERFTFHSISDPKVKNPGCIEAKFFPPALNDPRQNSSAKKSRDLDLSLDSSPGSFGKSYKEKEEPILSDDDEVDVDQNDDDVEDSSSSEENLDGFSTFSRAIRSAQEYKEMTLLNRNDSLAVTISGRLVFNN